MCRFWQLLEEDKDDAGFVDFCSLRMSVSTACSSHCEVMSTQVQFLLVEIAPGDSSRSCHKYHFCRDKGFVVTIFLSRQKFCHDKYLLLQARVCRDKGFVMTSILLLRQTHVCCDKSKLVMMKLLS